MKTGAEYLHSPEKRAFDTIFSRGLQPPSALAKFVASHTFTPPDESVTFLQTRVGANQEPLEVVKIRTLVEGSPDEPLSRLASLYRRVGLDELTQIQQIIEGSMSVFGERPLLKNERERLFRSAAKFEDGDDIVDRYKEIVTPAKPGILSTHAMTTHMGTYVKPRERLLMVIDDHENASIQHDSRILVKFVSAVVKGRLINGRIKVE